MKNIKTIWLILTFLALGFAIGSLYGNERIKYLEEKNERLQWELQIIKQDKKALGTFTCTAYCGCKKCCGHTHGITKSGTKATANRTIAVDTRHIPLGTRVCINGKWYIAEDTGKAIKGKRIDIYFDSHEEALEFGKKRLTVEV